MQLSSRRRHGRPERLDEPQALRRAYDEHGSELYRFALRQLGDACGAEDVVQEVFLRAWRAAGTFDPAVASLRVWLFALTRNAVIDEARRRSVRPVRAAVEIDDDRLVNRSSGVRIDEQALDRWVVEEALRRISDEHRAAIVEVHLRDRSPTEVAGEWGVPVGTVRSRMFYALKSLRLAIEEMGVEP